MPYMTHGRYVVIQNVHISTKVSLFVARVKSLQKFIRLDECSSCDSRRRPQLKHLVRTHPPIAATSLNRREGSDPLATKLHLSVGTCTLHVPPSLGVGVIWLVVGGVAIVTRGNGRKVIAIILAVRGWRTLTKFHLFDAWRRRSLVAATRARLCTTIRVETTPHSVTSRWGWPTDNCGWWTGVMWLGSLPKVLGMVIEGVSLWGVERLLRREGRGLLRHWSTNIHYCGEGEGIGEKNLIWFFWLT